MATTAKPKAQTPKHPARPRTPKPLADLTTIGDLLKRLGNIPARRVLLHPYPGTATEADLIKVLDRKERLCELVEGTLVEKPMDFDESDIAGLILTAFNNFVRPRRLGIVTGESGPYGLIGGLVRMPDVAFISWNRFPGRKKPKEPVPQVAPDLAVEVLSRSNTKAEIDRKIGEFFQAGTRLVWVVDPKKQTIRVYTAPDQSILLEGNQSLDGGDVLPGFRLALRDLFAGDQP